jgi:uncharacterized protein (DUF2147 family)
MKFPTFVAAFLLAATTTFGAGPNDLLGLWKTADDESNLEFFRCGEKVCVRIAWLKEPNYTDGKEGPLGMPKIDRNNPDPALRNRPMVGLQIMEGFTPAGDDRWEGGIIYDPDNGKTYRGKLHLLSPDRLELRGYIGISLFGRSYVLTR